MHFDAVSSPLAVFVLEAKTGVECKADRSRFSALMQGTESPPVVLVTVGEKGAKASANITGDKVGRMELSSKHGKIHSAQVVERLGGSSSIPPYRLLFTSLGAYALAVFTDKQDTMIYSLPHLELIHHIALPIEPSS